MEVHAPLVPSCLHPMSADYAAAWWCLQTMGSAYVPLTGKAAADAKAAAAAVGGGMTPLLGSKKVEAWMGAGYQKPPSGSKKKGK